MRRLKPGGSTSPGYRDVSHNNFSARWTGQLIPQFSQTYTFTTISDDGVRLYVDNNLVINDWFDHRGVSKGTFNVSAGPHTIKVEYYDFGRDAMITVWWAKK